MDSPVPSVVAAPAAIGDVVHRGVSLGLRPMGSMTISMFTAWRRARCAPIQRRISSGGSRKAQHIQAPMHPGPEGVRHSTGATGTAASRRRHTPPITPTTTDALAGVIEEGYHLHGRAAAVLDGGPRGAADSSVMAREFSSHESPIPLPPSGS